MDKNGKKATIEIVDGIPLWVSPRDNPPQKIRVKPLPPKKQKRVDHPLSISRKEQKALTFKMRHALKNYFLGMTKTDAGKEAGYAPGRSAVDGVNRALRIAQGNQAFLDEMEKQGIGNEQLITILKEGLKAKHPLSKDGNKDYRTIHSFWQDAVKMKDGFPAKRVKSESENKHIHIHITADDKEGIDKYERMRREAVDGSPDPY